jgi:hypothetical protein
VERGGLNVASARNRQPDKSQSGYPRRPSHFAHRFVRLLTKTALATELGPEVCWLLTVIAHTEDARHYTGPVNFWNEQLTPLCGFASVGRLIRARGKAVDAGWLGYQAGSKGKAGRYWVTIPPDVGEMPDGASDDSEGIPPVFPSKIERQTEGIRRANGGQTEGKQQTSYPIPNPNPPPPPSPNGAEAGKSNQARGEGEEVLISRGKELGLADVDAVRDALRRGWSAAALAALFDEFERRRPTWAAEIKSPCGLLARWLRTLEPDAAIPWPTSVKPVRRRATAEETAKKNAERRRFQIISEGRKAGLLEEEIGEQLAKAGLGWNEGETE